MRSSCSLKVCREVVDEPQRRKMTKSSSMNRLVAVATRYPKLLKTGEVDEACLGKPNSEAMFLLLLKQFANTMSL